jgi:hypothetical protein
MSSAAAVLEALSLAHLHEQRLSATQTFFELDACECVVPMP